jgi:S-disulfanyl-L-cysteine oxidoreductase SoxD
MFKFKRVWAALSLAVLSSALSLPTWAQSPATAGIGRPATAAELKAWDIDVRPDFLGLPKGSGNATKGMDIWENKCASCHGVFGESNEVFSPLTGGVKKSDIAKGRVERLTDTSFPSRTTMMKLSSLSTLWDYVNRAMPWNQPKSLTTDEVYSVVAYMLHLGDIVPADYTLSNENMVATQNLIPNRNGKTTEHAMWPGNEFATSKGSARSTSTKTKPDTQNTRCMANCEPTVKISSSLPDYARDAHGNLLEQNRTFGAQKGADTSKPAIAAPTALAPTAAAPTGAAAANTSAAMSAPAVSATPAATTAGPNSTKPPSDIQKILSANSCTACHAAQSKLVGPSFAQIMGKFGSKPADQKVKNETYLAGKIKNGAQGSWGSIPMPAQAISEGDAKKVAQWLTQ